MCRFKSRILLKDRVYIGDGDSHSDMLGELGIADTQQNAERVFVRAELYPEDDDVFSLVDQWKWKVDQDILPDWYVEEYEKQRFAEAVKKWVEQHIFIGQDGLTLTTGKSYYLKDCKNIELSGDCFVALLDSTQVGVMWESSIASIAPDYSDDISVSSIQLQDNAIVKDYRTKTIYQAGDWKLVSVDQG